MRCNTTELFFWTVIFAVESSLIIVGNIITIIVFWKLRCVLKKTYCLLINLTVSDLIVGFAAVERIVNNNIYILKNSKELRWREFIALYAFSGTASLTTLLLVAVERCYAILYPFRHRTLRTRIYINGVVGVWLMSILVAFIRLSPKVLPNSVIIFASPWILTCLAAMGVFAICCLYIVIWRLSKKEDPRISRDKREQNKRLAKTLFIVTATSVITWLPFAVTFVLPHHIRNEYDCAVHSASYVGRFTQLANSLLNPMIYCFRMPEFRRILKQDLFRRRRENVMNVQSGETFSLANVQVAVCEWTQVSSWSEETGNWEIAYYHSFIML